MESVHVLYVLWYIGVYWYNPLDFENATTQRIAGSAFVAEMSALASPNMV